MRRSSCVGATWLAGFDFELKVPSGRSFYLRFADMMREAAKRIGVRMRVSALEWSVFIQDYYDRKFDGVSLLTSFNSPWIDPYDSFHSSQDVPQGGNSRRALNGRRGLAFIAESIWAGRAGPTGDRSTMAADTWPRPATMSAPKTGRS